MYAHRGEASEVGEKPLFAFPGFLRVCNHCGDEAIPTPTERARWLTIAFAPDTRTRHRTSRHCSSPGPSDRSTHDPFGGSLVAPSSHRQPSRVINGRSTDPAPWLGRSRSPTPPSRRPELEASRPTRRLGLKRPGVSGLPASLRPRCRRKRSDAPLKVNWPVADCTLGRLGSSGNARMIVATGDHRTLISSEHQSEDFLCANQSSS